MVTWHPPRYTLRNRTWGGPACSLGILRAAHSGIRTWGGPACSLGIPPCCALRNSPWERPGGSCLHPCRALRRVLQHDAFGEQVLADPVSTCEVARFLGGRALGDEDRDARVLGAARAALQVP